MDKKEKKGDERERETRKCEVGKCENQVKCIEIDIKEDFPPIKHFFHHLLFFDLTSSPSTPSLSINPSLHHHHQAHIPIYDTPHGYIKQIGRERESDHRCVLIPFPFQFSISLFYFIETTSCSISSSYIRTLFLHLVPSDRAELTLSPFLFSHFKPIYEEKGCCVRRG